MARPEPGEVTRLLQSWSSGDKKALGELRGLAIAYIRRERRDHTLQATVLVGSAITVKRDWRIAKAVVHRQLRADVLTPAEQS